MKRDITAMEIRTMLHTVHRKLNGKRTKSALTERYRAKVRYMMLWLQLVPCRKDVLDNWPMPDYGTIQKMMKSNRTRKEAKTKKEGTA